MNKLSILLILLSIILSACGSHPAADAPSLPLDPTEDYDWLPERISTLETPRINQESPTLTNTPPIPTSTPVPTKAIGTVSTDALNLRLGPGLSHQVLGLLNSGTVIEITGRSESGDWLQVMLENGVSGWVSAQYVQTQVEITSLAVREAYGGAYPTTLPIYVPAEEQTQVETSASRENPAILVIIKDNLAEVNVKGFPANAKLKVLLRYPGTTVGIETAKGESSSTGRANITFLMPYTWADGNPLKSGEYVVEVSTVDGLYSQGVIIEYYR